MRFVENLSPTFAKYHQPSKPLEFPVTAHDFQSLVRVPNLTKYFEILLTVNLTTQTSHAPSLFARHVHPLSHLDAH